MRPMWLFNGEICISCGSSSVLQMWHGVYIFMPMYPPCFDAKITCVDRVLGLAEICPCEPHVTHPRISVFAGCALLGVLQMWHGVDIFMPTYPPCFDAKITCVDGVLDLAETHPCEPYVTHPRISVFAGCAFLSVLQMWHGV